MHSSTINQIRSALSRVGIKGVSADAMRDFEVKVLGAEFTEPLNKEQRASIVEAIKNSQVVGMIPVASKPEVEGDMKLSFTSQDTQIQPESPTQESSAIVDVGSPKYQMMKSTTEGYGLQLSETEMEVLFSEVDSRSSNMGEFISELAQIVETMANEVREEGLSKIAQIKDYYRLRMTESTTEVQQAADALMTDIAQDLVTINGGLKKSSQQLQSLNQRLQKSHQEKMSKSLELHQQRMSGLTNVKN